MVGAQEPTVVYAQPIIVFDASALSAHAVRQELHLLVVVGLLAGKLLFSAGGSGLALESIGEFDSRIAGEAGEPLKLITLIEVVSSVETVCLGAEWIDFAWQIGDALVRVIEDHV